MREKSFRLGIDLDTRDVVTLLEVGHMCAAIADQRTDARAALQFAAGPGAELAEAKHDGDFTQEQVHAAGEAFSSVEDSGRVDAGAAFAHATEGAALNGTTAGPVPGAGAQAEPAGLGTASPANLTPVAGPAGPATVLDKNGMPWDARINTSNKAQTQAGVWKRAPKLDDAVYNGVLAELKATMNGAPAGPSAGTTAAPQPQPPAGPGAGAPPGPGVQEQPAEAVPTTFPDFLAAISKRTTCNPPKLTKEEMDTCMQVVGATYGCALNTLADLNHRPDLIPAVYGEFAKVWGGK